ncbi:FAD-dependent oxidoreductase, partial [Streptomyces sp. NPDC056178]
RVLRSSGALVRLAMAGTPLQRTVRALIGKTLSTIRPASDKALGLISGISIAYAAPHGAHPLTAKRAPDLSLREGRLYQLLRDGTFVLVTPVGTVTPTTRNPLVHAHWTGGRTATLLVRPDGYIAWASDHADPAALQAALTR